VHVRSAFSSLVGILHQCVLAKGTAAAVHADAEIRSRTTQPRLNIGICAPMGIE
jgi:hypothetical protein